MDSLNIMSNSIQGITRICEAVDVFKVAGKDCDLGRGNLNGLECKVKKDWRQEDNKSRHSVTDYRSF